MSKFSNAIGAVKLAFHARQPGLLVVGGVVAMGAAAVIACKQTLKVEENISPLVADLAEHKQAEEVLAAKGELTIATTGEKLTPELVRERKMETYANIGRVLVANYAVPVVLFGGGAAMVFRSHSIMQQRNAALAMAFTTVKKTLDAYRKRVVEEQGHEADQRYLNGAKEAILNNNGYSQRVLTRDWDASRQDPYNRVFAHDTTDKWQNDLGANRHFIACQQRFAQQLLNHQGYIYLSDVYKSLGFAESDYSRVVGWKVMTNDQGDRTVPVVDFGIDKPLADDWKYNQERAIFLDFNCQGLILGGEIQEVLEKAATG